MVKIYQRIICLTILVVSGALMVWSLLPGKRDVSRHVLDARVMNPGGVDEGGVPALLERREVILAWPVRMHTGETVTVRMEFQQASEIAIGDGGPDFRDAYEDHNLMAEARLEMAGVRVEPGNPTRVSLPDGQPVGYEWKIRAGEEGDFSGRVWLSLRFLPLDGSTPVQVPVFVRDGQVKVRSILGMEVQTAIWVSGVGILAGGVGLIYGMRWKKNEMASERLV